MNVKCNRAFSLIELMVAIAIAMLLAWVIGIMMSALLKTWTQERGAMRKNMDARVALEIMANDLQTMVIRQGPAYAAMEWLRKENDSEVQSGEGYLASTPAWLTFIAIPIDRTLPDLTSSVPNKISPGDMCAISYRLGYTDPTPVSTSTFKLMGLFRAVIPSSSATDTSNTGVNTFTNVIGSNFATFWQQSSVKSQTQASANFLIGNVVDFQIAFEVIDPISNNIVIIPPSQTLRLGNLLSDKDQQPIPNVNVYSKVKSMDIILTLVSEDGAQRLRTLQGNAAAQKKVVLESGQRYVRRLTMDY